VTLLPSGPPRVINVGLDLFARTLAVLDVPVVHVDWRPPADGDARLAALLARLDARREDIEPNLDFDAEWFGALIERAINGAELPDYAGPDRSRERGTACLLQ